MTSDLDNLNLYAKLMVLLHQILFSLAFAVKSILRWISAEHVSSLHGLAPSYLKLVTSSNF